MSARDGGEGQYLDEAHRLISAGRFVEAETFCRTLLLDEPENAQASHLLGALALQAVRFDQRLALRRHEGRR